MPFSNEADDGSFWKAVQEQYRGQDEDNINSLAETFQAVALSNPDMFVGVVDKIIAQQEKASPDSTHVHAPAAEKIKEIRLKLTRSLSKADDYPSDMLSKVDTIESSSKTETKAAVEALRMIRQTIQRNESIATTMSKTFDGVIERSESNASMKPVAVRLPAHPPRPLPPLPPPPPTITVSQSDIEVFENVSAKVDKPCASSSASVEEEKEEAVMSGNPSDKHSSVSELTKEEEAVPVSQVLQFDPTNEAKWELPIVDKEQNESDSDAEAKNLRTLYLALTSPRNKDQDDMPENFSRKSFHRPKSLKLPPRSPRKKRGIKAPLRAASETLCEKHVQEKKFFLARIMTKEETGGTLAVKEDPATPLSKLFGRVRKTRKGSALNEELATSSSSTEKDDTCEDDRENNLSGYSSESSGQLESGSSLEAVVKVDVDGSRSSIEIVESSTLSQNAQEAEEDSSTIQTDGKSPVSPRNLRWRGGLLSRRCRPRSLASSKNTYSKVFDFETIARKEPSIPTSHRSNMQPNQTDSYQNHFSPANRDKRFSSFKNTRGLDSTAEYEKVAERMGVDVDFAESNETEESQEWQDFFSNFRITRNVFGNNSNARKETTFNDAVSPASKSTYAEWNTVDEDKRGPFAHFTVSQMSSIDTNGTENIFSAFASPRKEAQTKSTDEDIEMTLAVGTDVVAILNDLCLVFN